MGEKWCESKWIPPLDLEHISQEGEYNFHCAGGKRSSLTPSKCNSDFGGSARAKAGLFETGTLAKDDKVAQRQWIQLADLRTPQACGLSGKLGDRVKHCAGHSHMLGYLRETWRMLVIKHFQNDYVQWQQENKIPFLCPSCCSKMFAYMENHDAGLLSGFHGTVSYDDPLTPFQNSAPWYLTLAGLL